MYEAMTTFIAHSNSVYFNNIHTFRECFVAFAVTVCDNVFNF